ncbi:alpha/beta-hydrolase [Thelephora terrestris]|uniref:Alpha/beta-hydrolase n=1 Tax=Thelephora terrestris TaxID=56493 RepID=A0A9P6HPN6_9AGAM|nr:alpha/beta-hydrolase [Thelephora terrestris]
MTSSPSEIDLPTIFDPASLVKKGLCPVTEIRYDGDALESHSLYYEQHGTGPEKIVFIMGLNSTSFSWTNQVEYFGNNPKYSILVFDNRGVGNSGTPFGPYTTSEMARDVVVLLDYIGWKEGRGVHVVGISLGGMIAQELSTLIPHRIASLSLVVTTAGGRIWNNFPPLKGTLTLARQLMVKDPAVRASNSLGVLFPTAWLEAVAKGDPRGRTNRQIETENFLKRFYAARPQSFIGVISQMAAGLTHRVTGDRLKEISKLIPKVLIATGDEDHLVDPQRSRFIKANMPEAELVEFPGTGHAIQLQWPREFNELIARAILEGRSRLTERV